MLLNRYAYSLIYPYRLHDNISNVIILKCMPVGFNDETTCSKSYKEHDFLLKVRLNNHAHDFISFINSIKVTTMNVLCPLLILFFTFLFL